MKLKPFLTIVLITIGISAQAQQSKVVERPYASYADTPTLEITRVTLSDTATVLDIYAPAHPDNSIKITSATYLIAEGKNYTIRGGENIELDLLFGMPKSGAIEFKLVFEALPMETTKFDFIGSEYDDYYMIYEVNLTEESPRTTDNTKLEASYDVDEQLFENLIQPFKGKVILIDIWATWCGPCLTAHLLMQPLKAEFINKGVEFLYLAGEDSPAIAWENMIADISGSHYRLEIAQWDYLHDILNVRGVPTFIIIDRKGNQSFHSTGFPGVNTMRRELNRALRK
ncbi:MAG: TlpA family protein disulfide reductase [Bacteroidales bacterium]|nr:TlpA family protein disulfide reductase [Bacteroidales bacterium]